MFHDFEKIHHHAFQLAVLSMRKVADPPMDLMKMCLFFYVSYRPDNGGNPAKYFKIDNVRTETQVLLGDSVEVSAQLLQVGVFHGFAASVHLAFDPDPGVAVLRDAYADRPHLRWAD